MISKIVSVELNSFSNLLPSLNLIAIKIDCCLIINFWRGFLFEWFDFDIGGRGIYSCELPIRGNFSNGVKREPILLSLYKKKKFYWIK